MSKNVEIRVSLEEDLIKKIEKLKEFYGLKNTTELIRFMITEMHRQIAER